ncbi:hypothetical protein POL68_40435 [Stigmatella sp. ncwal1]|uniref:Uncharacterized protein n=1 Tax=Stigmatella ashevillensis TaxID=2995309 RepID=A0ABT5DM97_9BACT|nr:hypothetical protein [Stigmatella ashevillena]MDC0714787.1 hypothetical protein [Stigmatella ashevillena]
MAVSRVPPRPPPPPPPPPKKKEVEKKEVGNAASAQQTPLKTEVEAPPKAEQKNELLAGKPQDLFSADAEATASPVNLTAKAGSEPTAAVPEDTELPVELGETPTPTVSSNLPKAVQDLPALVSLAAVDTPAEIGPTAATETRTLSAEERAAQDVDIQTVAEDRQHALDAQQALRNNTTQQVQDLLTQSQTPETAPEGTSVRSVDANTAEMVRQDAHGNVIEHTVARRGEDGSVSIDSTGFKDGVNTHDRTEMLADGSSRVRHANWQSEQSEIGQQPSFEDIEKSRDPKYTLTDNRMGQRDVFGHWETNSLSQLTVDEYVQSGGSVKGSRTTFYTQQGGDRLDDKLQGPFHLDDGQPVDRATTHSYAIAAPDAEGNQPKPEYQRIERFSKGDVQATSFANSELTHDIRPPIPGPTPTAPPVQPGAVVLYEPLAGKEPHTREDLDKLRDAHEGFWHGQFDADEAVDTGSTPKRWLVELKKTPDSYSSQTFLEGSPNATITTQRQRTGDTVTESYSGKTYPPDGDDLVDVSGSSTSKYGADGRLSQLDSTRQDPDGTRQEHHYARTTESTPEGPRHTENTASKYWDAEGQESTANQSRVWLEGDKGLGQADREISQRNELTGPAGKAIHEVTEEGDHLTFENASGQVFDVTDASQFQSEDEKSLALTAAAMSMTASKAFVDGSYAATGLGMHMGVASALHGGTAQLNAAADGIKSASDTVGAVAGGVGGAVGVAGAAVSLAQAVGDKDKAAQALAGLQLSGATLDMTAAASVASSTLRQLGLDKPLGAAGAVIGAAAAIWDGANSIKEGMESGLSGKIAQGSVDIIAGTASALAAVLGAPIIGAAIGLGGFLIKNLIDIFNDDEHQISQLTIDD